MKQLLTLPPQISLSWSFGKGEQAFLGDWFFFFPVPFGGSGFLQASYLAIGEAVRKPRELTTAVLPLKSQGR